MEVTAIGALISALACDTKHKGGAGRDRRRPLPSLMFDRPLPSPREPETMESCNLVFGREWFLLLDVCDSFKERILYDRIARGEISRDLDSRQRHNSTGPRM